MIRLVRLARLARLALATLVVLGALSSVSPRAAQACAGCRNPSLPTSRGGEGPLPAGALRAGAALAGTTVHVIHSAGCADVTDCSEIRVQPTYLHDQHLYPVELRVSVEYGISKRFGVEVQLPVRAIRTRIDYKLPAGEPYEPLDAGTHHRDETVVGFGDPRLLFRVGGHLGVVWLAARAGVSLPLGNTEEDPFARGDQGLRHQHIQFGTGTLDPVLVLELAAPLDTWNLRIFAQTQLPLYENTHGYLAPTQTYGGASVGHLVIGALSGSAGFDVSHETPESWSGVDRQDGNLGRTELLGALGVSYGLGDGMIAFDIRVPIVRHLVQGDDAQGEFSSPVALSLAYARVFGAEERARAR